MAVLTKERMIYYFDFGGENNLKAINKRSEENLQTYSTGEI